MAWNFNFFLKLELKEVFAGMMSARDGVDGKMSQIHAINIIEEYSFLYFFIIDFLMHIISVRFCEFLYEVNLFFNFYFFDVNRTENPGFVNV